MIFVETVLATNVINETDLQQVTVSTQRSLCSSNKVCICNRKKNLNTLPKKKDKHVINVHMCFCLSVSLPVCSTRCQGLRFTFARVLV